MKKTLLILCALLLTSIGASAQTPYEFYAEDWVTLDEGRLYQSGITYNDDNTITVTPRTDTYDGANNVALGNSYTQVNTVATISTNGYYITSDQTCFVIVGTGLSTDSSDLTGNGAISSLWWLNGVNANVTPSTPISLSDGQTLFYWDFSNTTSVTGKFEDGKMVIDGWTGGGLTSTGETATISYIGFCTADEVNASFTPTNTYVHACTANESVWSTTTTLPSGEYVRLDTWATQSDEKMSLPFMEYYADGDAYLSDATISHEQLTGLTPGVYEVSMDIRIIDFAKDETGDNAKIGAGTKFIANGVSEDLLTGSDGTEDDYDTAGHDEVYGTYTLTCVVDEAGTLDISLDVKDATYSWLMWKNLKVKYLDSPAITWEMTEAGWGTMILPFAASVPEGLTLYSGSVLSLDSNGTTITVSGAATSIAANTPYLVKGTEGTYTFSGTYEEATTLTSGLLTGTLVDMEQDDFPTTGGTVYVLQNHDDEGLAFYPITEASSGVTLDAYHCYLTLDNSTSGSGVRAFISLPGSDNEETGIVAVESDLIASDAIYDLSGRKVSKAVKGVYIQNGKKVLVR